MKTLQILEISIFQSTLPRGERHGIGGSDASAILDFNPRSREGSDNIMCRQVRSKQKNFNPRSREGSDADFLNGGKYHDDFNPRSREGSDVGLAVSIGIGFFNFNPRSREGSDRCFDNLSGRIAISIHAPARGATVEWYHKNRPEVISIHAPARGATVGLLEDVQTAD